jgi:mRNA-degrading endonuclease HigB of HigAB toxin-antitoxin module
MRLIGRNVLEPLIGHEEAADQWVAHWISEIRGANWKQAVDVTNQFPNAQGSADGHFEFPVGGCQWVIQLLISFQQGIALITALKTKD